MGSITDIDNDKFLLTKISLIYLQYLHNNNWQVAIFTNFIFRVIQEILNDTLHDLEEYAEPAQIHCGTSNPDIETHCHCLEISITKTILDVIIQIINNVNIVTQEWIESVSKKSDLTNVRST